VIECLTSIEPDRILVGTGNAAQALPDGKGFIEVSVSVGHPPEPTSTDRDWLRLRVTDTGCGIRPDDMDRIFEPFFSTKPPHEGSGMGLSMVHGIVTEMKGLVLVESQPGDTCFDVWFPTMAAPRVDEPVADGDASRGNGERVLWVDDDPSVLRSGCAELSELGYVPTPVSSATQAREVAVAGAFDLMILDLILDDGSGLDLFREFAQRGYQDRILFCTGKVQELQALGFADEILIPKPLSPRELCDKVSALAKQIRGAVAR